ncbi:MAG: ABC transporter permease subunit [Thermoanaerobaculum sp.]
MAGARDRARRREVWVKALITGAALVVLSFTFLLFAYLFWEVLPLLRPARLRSAAPMAAQGAVLTFPGELPDSYWTLSREGVIRVHPQGDAVTLPQVVPPVAAALTDRWGRWLAMADGEGFKVYRLSLRPTFVGQERKLKLRISLPLVVQARDVRLLSVGGNGAPAVVGVQGGATFLWQGTGEALEAKALTPREGQAAAVNEAGDRVWLATDRELSVWDDSGKLLATAPLPAPVTAMSLLLGDTTCLVGDGQGAVRAFGLYQEASGFLLEPFAFFGGPGAVLGLAPSPRTKAFAVLRPGLIQVNYLTSGKVVAQRAVPEAARLGLAFSPRGERLFVGEASGRIHVLTADLGHPEATWGTLFGKVRYEGYRNASWTWQSTGGSNAFEPKLSLVPLIFGSFKGAFYAMLFSAPLGLLAALYTSQFAPMRLRQWVKPLVELLAGVPSVVVGFVAALVLAPWLSRHLESVLLALLIIPVTLFTAGWLCELRPRPWQLRLQQRWERLFTLGLLALALAVVWLLGPVVEHLLFPAGLLEFLHSKLGVSYDQRNALVTGFALGFAVLPVIFTLAEDALSNVPESLVNAALSLGASRARAAWTVVVPAAAPGLVAALLLGFGRAVGETMIVLMASGNAPVLSFSPFSGMRTMAACIAVELPEAAYGETLYRVLLLVALLLFAFTLATNLLGQRVARSLRRRFGVTP